MPSSQLQFCARWDIGKPAEIYIGMVREKAVAQIAAASTTEHRRVAHLKGIVVSIRVPFSSSLHSSGETFSDIFACTKGADS